jgi:hypothetical protein
VAFNRSIVKLKLVETSGEKVKEGEKKSHFFTFFAAFKKNNGTTCIFDSLKPDMSRGKNLTKETKARFLS